MAKAATLLESRSQAKLAAKLLGYVQDGRFAGIVVDFKSMPDGATGPHVEFLANCVSCFL